MREIERLRRYDVKLNNNKNNLLFKNLKKLQTVKKQKRKI